MSETALDIHPGDAPDTYVISGEIDMHTAPRIAEISVPPDRPDATIVLDFSGVSFIDSIGIWALVNLARGLEGGKLVIANAAGNVRRTFDRIDLSDATGIMVER
jgi:anti-anti-sigma factor